MFLSIRGAWVTKELVVPPKFESAASHVEQRADRFTFDQTAHHFARRQTVDIADHAAEFDTTIVEDLVQPVDFAGAHCS